MNRDEFINESLREIAVISFDEFFKFGELVDRAVKKNISREKTHKNVFDREIYDSFEVLAKRQHDTASIIISVAENLHFSKIYTMMDDEPEDDEWNEVSDEMIKSSFCAIKCYDDSRTLSIWILFSVNRGKISPTGNLLVARGRYDSNRMNYTTYIYTPEEMLDRFPRIATNVGKISRKDLVKNLNSMISDLPTMNLHNVRGKMVSKRMGI